MSPLTLTVAGPPAFVSSNSRGGWFVHDKAISAWRQMGAHAARRARATPIPGRVSILVIVHRTSNRVSDAQNVMPSIKAAIDGIVSDAKVLPGDDDRYIAELAIRRGPNRDQPALTIVITQETP